MSEDLMLKCLIAFILGWLLCRMMGNGFSVGAQRSDILYFDDQCRTYKTKSNAVLHTDDDCENLYDAVVNLNKPAICDSDGLGTEKAKHLYNKYYRDPHNDQNYPPNKFNHDNFMKMVECNQSDDNLEDIEDNIF